MRNFATHSWTRFTVDHKDRPAVLRVERGAKGPERVSQTYFEWTRRVQRLAIGLMDAGLEVGQRVGMVARNCPEWLELAWAVWMVGGVVVPLASGRERRETLRCLARAGADWIVVYDEAGLLDIRGQGANLPDHLRWICLKDIKAARQESVSDIAHLLERGKYRAQRGALDDLAKRMYTLAPDAPALILFAFEPGDDPHGATFGGGKLAVMLEYLGGDLQLDDSDVLAVLMGYSWFYGVLLTMAAMLQGRTLAIADGLAELEADFGVLQPTVIACGPATIESQLKIWQAHIERAPNFLKDENPFGFARALQMIGEKAAAKVLYEPVRSYFGGKVARILLGTHAENFAPVADEVLDILDASGVSVCGMFGIPEAGITHLERPEARRRHSVGRPIQGYVAKIKGAKTDESGPLLVKSDVLFSGYWDQKGPREIGEDGYLDTGAIGHISSAFLFLEPKKSA